MRVGLVRVYMYVCVCLSALSLASKCATSAFRMHIRADDTFIKMLSALHDAPLYPVRHCLSVCSSLSVSVCVGKHWPTGDVSCNILT